MKLHEEKKQLEKALMLISAKARELTLDFYDMFFRSEEGRVGEEGRSRWSP